MKNLANLNANRVDYHTWKDGTMELENWQFIFILVLMVFSISCFLRGLNALKQKNLFGLTPQYYILGVFVWGDALIFGLFWTLITVTTLILQDWILLWLVFFLFWTIRSLGETIYWFNQQFTSIQRNVLEHMPGYKLIQNDALWFIYQIMSQCICVISAILSIYFAALWLNNIF